MRITTLSENTAGTIGLLAEWGLSILVEADGLQVLLDTGGGIAAASNAPALGVDLRRTDRIVLSHGHADHTGGLREVLRVMGKKVEIIAHPDVWQAKFAERDGQYRYVGIPFQQVELESRGASFIPAREPVWLSENVVASGEIPMRTPFEQVEGNLYVREAETFLPESLADDQALVVRTANGLAVVLGCAHHGIINTLYRAQEITGVDRVHTVVGGTHLYRASPERLELTIAALQKFGIRKLGVSHCTGFAASARMAAEFGDRFFLNNAGMSLTVP
ncbi:MAG: MBL fold metallo-hydrolase [Chloroflexota bacterium]